MWSLPGLPFRTQQHLLASRSVYALSAPQLHPETQLKRQILTVISLPVPCSGPCGEKPRAYGLEGSCSMFWLMPALGDLQIKTLCRGGWWAAATLFRHSQCYTSWDPDLSKELCKSPKPFLAAVTCYPMLAKLWIRVKLLTLQKSGYRFKTCGSFPPLLQKLKCHSSHAFFRLKRNGYTVDAVLRRHSTEAGTNTNVKHIFLPSFMRVPGSTTPLPTACLH